MFCYFSFLSVGIGVVVAPVLILDWSRPCLCPSLNFLAPIGLKYDFILFVVVFNEN